MSETEKQPSGADTPPIASIKSYRQNYQTHSRIPTRGRDREDILREMEEMRAVEEARWEGGETVSSGGAGGILLAMKPSRDYARDKRGITKPQMIVPSTAHAAFDKAAEYFGIEIVHIPVGDDFRADVAAPERAITGNTIDIVGSAPP